MTTNAQELRRRMSTHIAGAKAIAADAEDAGRALTKSDKDEIEQYLGIAGKAKKELDAQAFHELQQGGTPGGLLAAFKSHGWEPGRRTAIEFKAGTFTGDVQTLAPIREPGLPLGSDQRWAFPAFATEAVAEGTTSVQILSQSARTLADPDDMVRDIDAVTPDKPETSSTREVLTVELKQVATVSGAVPNVLMANGFGDVLGVDMRLAFNDAVDSLCLDAITAADPPNTVPGDDLLASVRTAIADMQADGYNPSVVIVSPEDAATLDLLQSSGDEALYQFAVSARSISVSPLWGLQQRIAKGVTDPLVVDPSAVGKLYVSPVTLDTDPYSGFKANTTELRLEAHGAFGVQRAEAVRVIVAGS